MLVCSTEFDRPAILSLPVVYFIETDAALEHEPIVVLSACIASALRQSRSHVILNLHFVYEKEAACLAFYAMN